MYEYQPRFPFGTPSSDQILSAERNRHALTNSAFDDFRVLFRLHLLTRKRFFSREKIPPTQIHHETTFTFHTRQLRFTAHIGIG
jgi:hypothetical protein